MERDKRMTGCGSLAFVIFTVFTVCQGLGFWLPKWVVQFQDVGCTQGLAFSTSACKNLTSTDGFEEIDNRVVILQAVSFALLVIGDVVILFITVCHPSPEFNDDCCVAGSIAVPFVALPVGGLLCYVGCVISLTQHDWNTFGESFHLSFWTGWVFIVVLCALGRHTSND